ncbi:MAG: 30S ribosomal protein S17 [Candidatus Pacebacteria bacterium]|nr:30S ribosomal protein S17 [Candidatus Paceibacterota bacterium]
MATNKEKAHKASKDAQARTETSRKGRVLRGTVVSVGKMVDTTTVAVERYVKHPKYKKYQRLTKKFLVHDAGNTAELGSKVEIREVKPISKRKRFELVG